MASSSQLWDGTHTDRDQVEPLFLQRRDSGLGAQFTIETWPLVEGEYFMGSSYMKCILQAGTGQYLNANSTHLWAPPSSRAP